MTEQRQQHAGAEIPETLGDLKVCANPSMLVVKDAKVVRRTWSERLASWPWKPWVSQRLDITMGPDPSLYRIGSMVVGHPATIAAATQQLARAAEDSQRPWTVH